jgi:hypothetical protein
MQVLEHGISVTIYSMSKYEAIKMCGGHRSKIE